MIGIKRVFAICFSILASFNIGVAEVKHVGLSCFYKGEHCDDMASDTDAILISGEIFKADEMKFIDALMDSRSSPVIILRSSGGNVYAAMAIGRIARRLFLETDAPIFYEEGKSPICIENRRNGISKSDKCVCASSCFLIYVSGVPRNQAYVLLHRPFINPDYNKNLDVDDSLSMMSKIKKRYFCIP